MNLEESIEVLLEFENKRKLLVDFNGKMIHKSTKIIYLIFTVVKLHTSRAINTTDSGYLIIIINHKKK